MASKYVTMKELMLVGGGKWKFGIAGLWVDDSSLCVIDQILVHRFSWVEHMDVVAPHLGSILIITAVIFSFRDRSYEMVDILEARGKVFQSPHWKRDVFSILSVSSLTSLGLRAVLYAVNKKLWMISGGILPFITVSSMWNFLGRIRRGKEKNFSWDDVFSEEARKNSSTSDVIELSIEACKYASQVYSRETKEKLKNTNDTVFYPPHVPAAPPVQPEPRQKSQVRRQKERPVASPIVEKSTRSSERAALEIKVLEMTEESKKSKDYEKYLESALKKSQEKITELRREIADVEEEGQKHHQRLLEGAKRRWKSSHQEQLKVEGDRIAQLEKELKDASVLNEDLLAMIAEVELAAEVSGTGSFIDAAIVVAKKEMRQQIRPSDDEPVAKNAQFSLKFQNKIIELSRSGLSNGGIVVACQVLLGDLLGLDECVVPSIRWVGALVRVGLCAERVVAGLLATKRQNDKGFSTHSGDGGAGEMQAVISDDVVIGAPLLRSGRGEDVAFASKGRYHIVKKEVDLFIEVLKDKGVVEVFVDGRKVTVAELEGSPLMLEKIGYTLTDRAAAQKKANAAIRTNANGDLADICHLLNNMQNKIFELTGAALGFGGALLSKVDQLASIVSTTFASTMGYHRFIERVGLAVHHGKAPNRKYVERFWFLMEMLLLLELVTPVLPANPSEEEEEEEAEEGKPVNKEVTMIGVLDICVALNAKRGEIGRKRLNESKGSLESKATTEAFLMAALLQYHSIGVLSRVGTREKGLSAFDTIVAVGEIVERFGKLLSGEVSLLDVHNPVHPSLPEYYSHNGNPTWGGKKMDEQLVVSFLGKMRRFSDSDDGKNFEVRMKSVISPIICEALEWLCKYVPLTFSGFEGYGLSLPCGSLMKLIRQGDQKTISELKMIGNNSVKAESTIGKLSYSMKFRPNATSAVHEGNTMAKMNKSKEVVKGMGDPGELVLESVLKRGKQKLLKELREEEKKEKEAQQAYIDQRYEQATKDREVARLKAMDLEREIPFIGSDEFETKLRESVGIAKKQETKDRKQKKFMLQHAQMLNAVCVNEMGKKLSLRQLGGIEVPALKAMLLTTIVRIEAHRVEKQASEVSAEMILHMANMKRRMQRLRKEWEKEQKDRGELTDEEDERRGGVDLAPAVISVGSFVQVVWLSNVYEARVLEISVRRSSSSFTLYYTEPRFKHEPVEDNVDISRIRGVLITPPVRRRAKRGREIWKKVNECTVKLVPAQPSSKEVEEQTHQRKKRKAREYEIVVVLDVGDSDNEISE